MYRKIYRGIQLTAKIAVFLIALLALCGVLVIGLTQVDSFRDWLVQKGLTAVNGGLEGKISIGSTSGNLFTGIRIRDVRLQTANTTLISAPILDLKYHLLPLLSQKIIGAEVTIYNPTIRLVRNATDSTWNYAHITKPSTDTTSSPFNWTIDLTELDIRNATLSMQDLTVPDRFDTVKRAVDFSHLDINQFNLAMQAHISPTAQSLWIQNLSFNLPRPDIRVVELSGNVSLDTTGLGLRGLHLETSRSLLTISGRVDSVNFFESGVEPMGSWKQYPISLELDGERVSTLELRRFLPDLDFLGGTPQIKLSAHGKYGDLSITQLDLNLAHSHVALQGRLKNLNVPDSLYIDATINDSHLSYDDVPIYVPGLGLPDLSYLGTVTVRRAGFTGYPQNFTGTIDASTAVGSAKGGAWLDARGKTLQYNADLAFLHLNLEPILTSPDLHGDLTGRILANGSGTSLDELNSRIRLLLDGSTLAGRNVRKLYLDGQVRDRGYVVLDTLMAAMGEKSEPAATSPAESLDDLIRLLQSSIRASFGERNTPTSADRAVLTSNNSISTGGWIDLRNLHDPHYSVRVHGRGFDPASVLLDPSSSSNLSFTAEITGSGLAPDDIQGNGMIDVTSAQTQGKVFQPFSAKFALTRQDRNTRSLSVSSTLADIDISGEWRFETIVPSIARGVGSIADYVGRKAKYREESILFGGVDKPFAEPINATYKLTLKDLTPLELFMGGGTLVAEGDLAGNISGTPQLLSISANGTLQRFLYQKDSINIQLLATTLQVDLRNITPNRIEDISSAQITIRSDSVARFNDLTFGTPNVNVGLDAGLLTFRGSTAINGQFSVAVDGSVDATNPQGYGIRLDTAIVAIPGGNQWRNVGPISAIVSEGGVRIDTFAVQRTYQRWQGEIVEVSGGLNGSNFDNVHITIRRGSLRALPAFFAGDQLSSVRPLGGIVRLGDFAVTGTLESPVIDGRLVLDSISYSNAPIGNIQATLHYEDKNIHGRVIVSDIGHAPADTSVLLADVEIASFPIDLAIASRDNRFLDTQPVSVTAHTRNLPIAFLSPFLPGTKISGGTADIDFSAGGSVSNLIFKGTGDIKKGRILIEGNNITYITNAHLTFENQTLKIEQATLQNDPRDLVGGLANVTGSIQFDGFSIKQVDIFAETGRLLVLSDATQAVNSTVYGDLVIATSNGPIELTGSLDQPMLRGDIDIVNGNLRFPENDNTAENTSVVKYIDYATWQRRIELPYGPPSLTDQADSAAAAPRGGMAETQSPRVAQDTGSLTSASQQLLDQIEKTTGLQTGGDLSLADKILFDLNIAVTGRLFITMDLSPVEQVQAEISSQGQPLHITRGTDGAMKAIGTLSILQGSKYNFLRSFDASGSLIFKEDLGNPSLNLTANYSGQILNSDGTPQQDFEVTVTITGTTKSPQVVFSYTIDNRRPTVTDQEEQTRNAISLLLFNRTTDQLGAAGSAVGSTVSSTVGSTGSLAVSRLLSDIFTSSLGFLRSVSLDVGNRPGDFSRTRVNVVSQFGKLVLRYGGEISSPSDGVITIDVPLGALFDANFLRNITVQGEAENRTQETSGIGSTSLGSGSLGSTAASQSQTVRIRVQVRVAF